VSTGETSDAQANLLRQIETLQTQYAVASENWQGIEETLLSRVSSLEKERDELSARESQIRKKAREVVSFLERKYMDSLRLTTERISNQNEWKKSSKHRLPGYVASNKISLKARSK
jgi:TATA element modulatory factor